MRERLAAWRRSRPVRWIVSIVGVLLTLQGLIGLPQLPDQLRSWSPLITGAWDALHGFLGVLTGDWARFFVVLVGVVLLVVLNVPWERFRNDPMRGHTVTYDGRIVPRDGLDMRPIPAAALGPREMVSVTPEYLVGLLAGKTDLQAKADVAEYVGKWMRVSGPLANVHPNDRLVVVLATQAVAYLYFGKEWTGTLATIPPGHVVEVVGRIESVQQSGVSLDNCELAQSSRPAIS